jgi:hypothetical protein
MDGRDARTLAAHVEDFSDAFTIDGVSVNRSSMQPKTGGPMRVKPTGWVVDMRHDIDKDTVICRT